MSDKNYVVYHLHTENSLLDSCTNYKLYIDRAVELGQKAICFTEHGNIYNWIEKKMYANEHGLKYLHGCEVYLTEKLFWEKIPENFDGTGEELKQWIEDNKYKVRDNYHTILIAKNYEGFKEINKLIDLSTQPDHFYYKPRLTFDEFFNISDNVIKISACLASPLSKYPSSENANRYIYDKLLRAYDFYEIQPHNHPDQIKYNKMLVAASNMYDIPLIVGTDTHSLNKYKAECRSILQKAKKIQYTDEDKFDLTYKSYDELIEMFKVQNSMQMFVVEEAINNTNVLADMCEDWELDKSFKYPVLYDNEEKVLKQRINKMYLDKVKRGIIKPDPRYKEMVQEEMRVFKKIGMVGFMLFMSELVTWCWDNDIPVGFCRGSVGGSMIAYLTDIIDVNPLTWGTIFSRFANEDRKEIGDIDLDISPSQRHLVYEHIIEEFGSDKTAYVLAIGTMVEKGTIDEIGRALSDKWRSDFKFDKKGKIIERISDSYKEEVSTILPYEFMQTNRANELFNTFINPYSLDNIAMIKKEYENNPDETKKKYPDIFYYFDGLLGTAISQSMHPAGIIVSPLTLPDNYGTFWNDGKRILCINMEEIHEVSLVKYDVLGLKNIEIIKDTCKLANIPYPKSHVLNWDDALVWEHINDSPVGIFQFESPFAFDSMKKMGCKSVNDLSMVNASIRPSGESYRDRLLAGEINKNPSEIIDKLLEKNRQYLLFQEDTIKFLMYICGLSGSEADNIRRAIGRKQVDRLEEALPRILEGYCSKSDKPREVAEEEAKTFLKIIEDSSRYQFGYNHSTGYSMIGYTCAYLRYYYPKEFITAYLNNANNDKDINDGTALAEQFNIIIHPARFRHSIAEYSCDNTGIHKGISSIKFLNEKIAEELYELRDESFNSFVDLLANLKNTSINSRQLDILAKLNFFEEFGDINHLLQVIKLFDTLYGKKQIKKDKVAQLGYNEEIFRLCSGKETEKMFTKLDDIKLINKLEEDINVSPVLLIDQLRYELECLGYVTSFDNSANKRDYFVVEVDSKKTITNVKLHEIFSGKTREVRMWTNGFIKNEFKSGDLISINVLESKNKKEPTGEVDENGKRIYIETDKKEFWLKSYNVKERGAIA